MDYKSAEESFDWENISDVETANSDEELSNSDVETSNSGSDDNLKKKQAGDDDDDEAKRIAESKNEFNEKMASVFYVGAKFKTMEDLREKAKELGKQFNCPIETGKSSRGRHITMQWRHSGVFREARKKSCVENNDDVKNCNSNKLTRHLAYIV